MTFLIINILKHLWQANKFT